MDQFFEEDLLGSVVDGFVDGSEVVDCPTQPIGFHGGDCVDDSFGELVNCPTQPVVFHDGSFVDEPVGEVVNCPTHSIVGSRDGDIVNKASMLCRPTHPCVLSDVFVPGRELSSTCEELIELHKADESLQEFFNVVGSSTDKEFCVLNPMDVDIINCNSDKSVVDLHEDLIDLSEDAMANNLVLSKVFMNSFQEVVGSVPDVLDTVT